MPVAIDPGDTLRNGEHGLAMPIAPVSSPEAVMRIGAVETWAAAVAGSLRAAVFIAFPNMATREQNIHECD
jgi:hypothetical protein